MLGNVVSDASVFMNKVERIYMLSSRKISFLAATAMLGSLYATSPVKAQLNYKVSWIGNTFGKEDSNKWVQNNIAALYVAPDGTCYTNSTWDEGHHEGGIYKNGDVIGNIADLHMNHWWGGSAVAGNDTHLYVSNGDQIRRHNLNGSRGDWTETVGGRIHGLAVDKANGLIYSAAENDGAGYDGEIRVYNLSTKALVRKWNVATPRRIAVAPDGSVWITQRKTATANGRVLHYSATGTVLSQSIVGGTSNPGFDPTALVFDANGRLLVGDNGPDQQVKIYTNLGNNSPTLSATFGAKGGIYSGVAGAVAPLKFNGITGLGVDSSGNIYVAQNRFGPEVNNSAGAGSILESYTATGTRNWQLLGLEFVDNADATPGTDGTEVYTKYARYSLDFSKTNPGGEWTYKAHTMNPFKYPDDTRYEHRLDNYDFSTGYVVRMIGGKKFQFNYSMWGNRLEVYRFNSATDGEIAIPCGQISSNSIWRDLNGNGRKEASEWVGGTASPSNNGITSFWVDTNGDLWQSYPNGPNGSSGVRRFTVQGLDANGSPIWNVANSTSTQQPAPFSEIYRMEYVAETDTMYLAGYSNSLAPGLGWNGPNFNIKGIGSVIARYDNWKTGNRNARWTQVFTDYPDTPTSMAIAGDFVFIGYDGGSYQADSGRLQVRRASDGVDVGMMWAGPYNIGRMDIEAGVRAVKRANGEYVIFSEDDWYARVMLYRWTPPASAPAAVTTTATPGNSYVKLSWTRNSNASRYWVKRSTSPTGTFTIIADTEATSLTDINNGTGLTNGTTYYYKVQAVGAAGNSPDSATASATPAGSYALRVDSGSWSDSGDWIGESFYSGGGDTITVGNMSTTGVTNAAPANIYTTVRRKGNPITYTFPNQVAGATYRVRLHFGEWWFGTGQRLLNVSVNGTQVLNNLDVNASAGGLWKAHVRELASITPNASNQIIVTIQSSGETMISGIELLPNATAGPNLVTNPGFEANAATQTPTGWSEWSNKGGVGSGYTETGGNSGSYRGVHWNSAAYNMYTYQIKTGLANGLYTLRTRAKRGGGTTAPITCQLEAKDYGGSTRTAAIPASSAFQLLEIKDINVTNGQCTIGIWSNANAGNWAHFDDLEFFKQ